MFNSKYNGFLTIVLIIAIIGIVALIAVFGWSMYNKHIIDAEAANAVDSYERYVAEKNKEKEDKAKESSNTIENQVDWSDILSSNNNSTPAEEKPETSTPVNTKPQYKGFNMLGTIKISKLNIEYPVLDRATPQAIKVAVGYLWGPGLNQVGNTVIQGHNYRNGMFFSRIDELKNGDKIQITDNDGNKVTYEVYSVFQAGPSDTSFYNRDTGGLREITLSTCTDNGKMRVIVLAKEI